MEQDPIRCNDSFQTFEEILKLAVAHKVDFILLGGDLFHENKPSRKSLFNCMTLIRQYCFGDGECHVEFLSDQSVNFSNRFGTVNYQDPNYNVKIPIFSIHGNHDDPSGDGNLCALDLLSVSGLINYFGKQTQVDDIEINPLLMRKGDSRLAIYGLGNIRDERLHRTFEKQKVKMLRPVEDTDDWFNLFVIHQNRIAHSQKNYIPDRFLDSFLNLCLWGHEHECLIEPQESVNNFFITQPGSSIATSLSEGESAQKHIGILKITGQEFQLEKIKLKTVRPFVMDNVELSKVDGLDPGDKDSVALFLRRKVSKMIIKAKQQWLELNSDKQESDFPKPLIRLRVEYSEGFTTFNPQRFGQNFVETVANPKDILQFYRKKAPRAKKVAANPQDILDIESFLPENIEETVVEDFIADYLNAHKLEIIPENEFTDVIEDFIQKQDKEVISTFIDDTIAKTREMIELNGELEIPRLKRIIHNIKEQRKEEYSKQEQDDFEDEEYVYVNEDEKKKQVKKAAPVKARPKSTRGKKTRDSDEDVDMSEENEEVAPKKRKTMEVNSQTRKRARKAPVEEIEPAVPEKPIQRSKSKRLIVEEDEEMKPILEPKVEPEVEPPKRKGRLLPTSFSASGTKKKKAVRQSTLNFTPSQR
ncbi:Double-strand break repair protein mre11a [Boothiomyces macroporosus]|uniref:Double-strand break repair protein n=1 Tax=Boothiomyces macroporosus TaxID=261099 RepID=A0AAD5Y4S6_9FUNG|nr:Double-strand break repair protein mre11a [Boothiomyces macroporosus]